MQITHPFHPLCGRWFEVAWCYEIEKESQIGFYLEGDQGPVRQVPIGWTNHAEPDAFRVFASGRCPFRIEDLLRLANLIASLDCHDTDK